MLCNWRLLFVLILSTNMSCKTDNASNKNISIEKEDSRLNIVIIMVDDLDYSDLVCFGGEIDTPNLNGLDENWIRLSTFYNTARCCSSIASMLIGLYPCKSGVGKAKLEPPIPVCRLM